MSDATLRTAAADAGGTNLEGAFFAMQNGATSADQVSTQRLAPTYSAGAASVAALASTLAFTGPASAAVSHVGVWSAATAGTFRFAVPLAGGSDLAFNAAGEYNLTAANVTVS